MRKASKRRVRLVSEPAMTRLVTNPEIGIAERMAVEAMRGGWADYANSYRVLADCHGILTIGKMRKKDASLDAVLALSNVALRNIYDRYIRQAKVGATGDELQALDLLVNTAEEWWNRQTAAALELAIQQLKIVRDRQIKEKRDGKNTGAVTSSSYTEQLKEGAVGGDHGPA